MNGLRELSKLEWTKIWSEQEECIDYEWIKWERNAQEWNKSKNVASKEMSMPYEWHDNVNSIENTYPTSNFKVA